MPVGGDEREQVETVVVGSGFGAAVAAFRLADAGHEVVVLERGKAYPPGSFARSPGEMATNFWDPSKGLHGLFNLWSFDGIEAVVSSGLGGGSLIYANVLIRKDERWFVTDGGPDDGYERWPIERADLEPHYDRVEAMMHAQRFPFESPGYDATPKTAAFKEAADTLGLDWHLPPLAVSFANQGQSPRPGQHLADRDFGNVHGLELRQTCRMCGECDIGCNFGSKNTLDHNYLSAAHHKGADLRTRSEVRRILPLDGGGYQVDYVEHLPDAEGVPTSTSDLPVRTIDANRVVLGAGTLGTTYLLLRNRSALSNLSPMLGSRFCGNGDLLGFMVRAKDDGEDRLVDGSHGPVITSAIRIADALDPDGSGRGFYIEDAGYPEFANWMVESASAPGRIGRIARFAIQRVWDAVTNDPRSDYSSAIAALLGDTSTSTGSLPLLGMGRDIPDGQMRLRGPMLDIDWTIETSQDYFDRVEETMRDIADALDAEFKRNALSYLNRVVTVHPLGGAPMGVDRSVGVIDPHGEVFDYPDLYVVDGAALPGPVGPNPALTIAAFADRVADGIIERSTAGGSR